MSLYEDKHRLFAEYIKEVNRFTKKPLTNSEKIRALCDEYINSDRCTWKNIFDKNNEKLVGFLVIGKAVPYCHLDAERCVLEAYVDPMYRGQGLMTERVRDYESRHHVVWCYRVFTGNTEASIFWSNLFKEMGYEPIDLDSTLGKNSDSELDLYGWRFWKDG